MKGKTPLDAYGIKEGLKCGIIDMNELVRFIIANFMIHYEETHGLMESIKGVELSKTSTD